MFSINFTLENFEYYFSALVALLLYFVVDFSALNYSTVVGYAFLVVKEAITGLIIGFG